MLPSSGLHLLGTLTEACDELLLIDREAAPLDDLAIVADDLAFLQELIGLEDLLQANHLLIDGI